MIELFPYQIEGHEWLSKRRLALLADEMGLGKSAQAIKAADAVNAERILVLCPAVARINWVREFEKFSALSRPSTVIASQMDVTGVQELTSPICVVSSYDLAMRSEGHLNRIWDLIILDESHYLKSLDAKRTQAVYGKNGVVRKAKRVWCLSGTPAPNHPAELWPMLFTFGRTRLTYRCFIEKFCTGYLGPHGFQITGTRKENIEELRELLKPVMLRRLKVDVMKDLPPISYRDLVIEPGEVDLDVESSFIQYVFPNDRRAELKQRLDNERQMLELAFAAPVDTKMISVERMRMFEAMANSVATLRRYTGLQKVKGAVELIAQELEDNAYEKVVLFCIHRDVIENLRRKLHKFNPVTLYGGTPIETRQKNIDKFQKNPKCRVFIGNIQAAGTNITLTSAHNVVFVEQDWVPGNNAQAAMRCHRIGQTKPVFVRFLSIANSIDEKIATALRRKTRELTEIFDERQLPTSIFE